MATPVTYNILQTAQLTGALQFVGANAIGPKLTMVLNNVLIKSAAAINLIHDEWGQLALEGEVLANIATGSFGTITHPDSSQVSPNTGEYYIGKGIVSWEAAGTNQFIDIGNVSSFEFTPNVKVLDHYSSRLGIKTKDLSVVQEKSATVKLTMDEFTAFNLQLVLLGQ